ncbi:cyclic nucleotide-binding domain-containing protein [Actinomadura rudentiformis]|uniref:Cyclic nucleotide-binding domain-containing protein n=1 Tax=Actinomadura rudentiformis TaxID=359158 RepID=A0A6H9Y9C6_9ACTN|nr:cyclic nucleotide-binding domain-containing protein [Actinomadura rudentiformis]KAB2339997.1 cyclic nucleotide-binding domain-containing protein [Actinomadura rudentiformis]
MERTAAGRFWHSLSEVEQQELLGLGQRASHPPGTVLCHEDASATDVMVILDGWAQVCCGTGSEERIVALRGPGDLLGERAALMVRSRSATVVTRDAVEILVVPAEGFAGFLEEHPRAAALLEQQLYGRLNEDRVSGPLERIGSRDTEWTGQNCSIFFTDIASFNDPGRTDEDRRIVKRVMYEVLRDAFAESGVQWTGCHHEDRGDGALLVVPPTVPTTRLVDPLVSKLAVRLRSHNRRAGDVVQLQLRAALHVGPVTSEEEGVSGEAVSQAARLLDAPILKSELARTGADLGFVVSHFVYDSVVKHAPGSVDPLAYRRIKVRVKEAKTKAWIYLSAGVGNRTPELRARPSVRPSAPAGPLFEGDLKVEGDLVMGNKIIIRD